MKTPTKICIFKYIIILTFGISCSLKLQAQIPNKIWDKDLGSGKTDSLTVMVKTADGNYLLGGSSDSTMSADKTLNSKGGYDYWIIKISPNGIKIWDQTFGGSSNDFLEAILPTSDGGFLLGGSSASPVSGDKSQPSKGAADYWVIKIQSNGVKQWDRTIGGSKNDFLTSLAIHNGNFVLGGRSQSSASGDKSEDNFVDLFPGAYDYWVVRMSGSGNVLWNKTVGSTSDDDLDTIFVTTSGDYVLVGSSGSGTNLYKSEKPIGVDGFNDYWVVKINSTTGAKIWDNTIGGTEEEYLFSAVESGDGGYVLAGISFSDIGGDNTAGHFGAVVNARADYWVVKISGTGQKLWDRVYGGVDHDLARCIIKTSDNGYLVGGWSESGVIGSKTAPNKGKYDYWIVKTDVNGIQQWDAAFGGSGDDFMEAAIQNKVYNTTRNGFLLGGSSRSPISGDKSQNVWFNNLLEDYWVIQTTSP